MVITYNMRTGETHSTPMTEADREYAIAMLTRQFQVRQQKLQDQEAAEPGQDEQQ